MKFGEAVVFFKKRDINHSKIGLNKNYFKNAFNVIHIGDVRGEFNILSIFDSTFKNGILPLFNDYKNQNKDYNEYGDIDSTEKIHFNAIFKRFNEI